MSVLVQGLQGTEKASALVCELRTLSVSLGYLKG